MASQREESDSGEESSLSDSENLVSPEKKETRQKSAIGDRIGKLVLHFQGTKRARLTAKVELLTSAFADDNVALSASSFAYLH